jgi:hypothetical protein
MKKIWVKIASVFTTAQKPVSEWKKNSTEECHQKSKISNFLTKKKEEQQQSTHFECAICDRP